MGECIARRLYRAGDGRRDDVAASRILERLFPFRRRKRSGALRLGDIVAGLVHTYYRVRREPLRSLRLLVALLAAAKYNAGLPINADFYAHGGVIDSGMVKAAVDEAVAENMIRKGYEKCYDPLLCDEYGYVYVFRPGPRRPELDAYTRNVLEKVVREYGGLNPHQVLLRIFEKHGIPRLPDYTGNLDDIIAAM